MIMDRLKVLRLYLATRMHFTTKSYDIFKYKAAVKNCNEKTLSSHPGRRALVERLAKRFKTPGEAMGYLVPQWIYSNGDSLYDPMSAEENYERWQKFKTAPSYFITSDLHDKHISSDEELLKAVSSGKIKIETAIALNSVLGLIQENKDYFIWQTTSDIIKKSGGFIANLIDKDVIRNEIGYHENA